MVVSSTVGARVLGGDGHIDKMAETTGKGVYVYSPTPLHQFVYSFEVCVSIHMCFNNVNELCIIIYCLSTCTHGAYIGCSLCVAIGGEHEWSLVLLLC